MAHFMHYPLQKMETLLQIARKHYLSRGRTFSNLEFPPVEGDNASYGAIVVKPEFIDEVVTSIPHKKATPDTRPEQYSTVISMMPAGEDTMLYRQPRGVSVKGFLEAAGYRHSKTIANGDGVTIDTYVLGLNVR
jgi:hypothetical protein